MIRFAAFFIMILLFGGASAQKNGHGVVCTDPPRFGFFTKYLNSGGIPVRSSGEVDNKALSIASAKISLMLRFMPEARYNLVQWGAEMHVIGRKQQTSDLPEYRGEKGKMYTDTRGTNTNIDERTRGKGGIYTSCGEENLLGLKEDRYAGGSDICIHEFAHAIMDFGFDEQLEKVISDQFRRSTGKGLWKGAYAATNEGEYWAELSMWYFGGHGEFLSNSALPAPGQKGLMAYDREGYELVRKIYTGLLKTSLTRVLAAQRISSWPVKTQQREKAYLMIVNDSALPLKVSCLEADGKEKHLPDVAPFTRGIEFTRLDQAWKISREKAVSFYKVNSKYAIIVPVAEQQPSQKKDK